MDPTLRHFLRLSAELEPACALDLMHAECLRGLAEVWQAMQARGDLTPMHFPEALRLLAEHVAEALAGAPTPWSGLGSGLGLTQTLILTLTLTLAGATPPWQVRARLSRAGGFSDGMRAHTAG